ncbi:MAG: hypothetical protein L6Q99_03605 [Planctomycetes bacterium]|nr:hypothetical protein [Planctomycetota bacterium]
MSTSLTLLVASALCAFASPASPPQASAAQAPADTFEPLDHARLSERLRALAASFEARCELAPLGKSRAGREIWYLRIGAKPAERARPAVLVVANLEGPELFSSSIALALAERAARAEDDAARGFLANTTLFVIPRLDVDAAEARFARPLAEALASGHGVDDDRDGREGEDPPADIDGDGRITTLRVLDPEGEWLEDPHDARVLVRADRTKGERGRFKLWPEGRDLDRDERVAEDAPQDAWLNVNFPQGWKEHDAHAGLFATDEPGARALCDFVLAHSEIAAVVTLGGLDDLVEKPPIAKGGDGIPQGWMENDAHLLAEVGKRYAEVTGNKAKGTRDVAGSFQGWAYAQRGLWVFAANPWDLPLEAPKAPSDEVRKDEAAAEPAPPDAEKAKKPAREPSEDAKRLKWIDATGESARFVAWRPFSHPELGPVEVGGFAPFARVEPPLAERAAIAAKHADFVLSLGALLPRVAVVEFTARALGADVWEVRAALENPSFLPLSSAAARRNSAVRPARVTLELRDGDVLLAGSRRELVRELEGSGGRREFRWLVRTQTPRALALEVDTDHAGLVRREAEVQP